MVNGISKELLAWKDSPEFEKELQENFSSGFNSFLEKNRLRVVDVARFTGLTSSAVSAWKNGKGCPDYKTLCKLVIYGMSIEEMFNPIIGKQAIDNGQTLTVEKTIRISNENIQSLAAAISEHLKENIKKKDLEKFKENPKL